MNEPGRWIKNQNFDWYKWNNNANRYSRRQNKLRIGYKLLYFPGTGNMQVEIFAVQYGRTPTKLGELQLARDEWSEFHDLVWGHLEDLGPSTEEEKKAEDL